MVSFIQYINRIQFGFGAIGTLPAELQALGARRPLLMSDGGVVAAGLLDRVRSALQDLPASSYLDCPRHPTEAAAQAALAMYRAEGCDAIVAVGGGAVIDLAKAVALLHTHAGPLGTYSSEQGGSARIRPDVAPVVAIPTTAGTGSEIGRGAGVALGDGGIKAVFLSVNLVPKVAICDPGLTLSLPPGMTAGAGIDALGHCLEAYLSPAINPPVDATALDGIRRLAGSLATAVERPGDREARWNTMMGALEGGMCFWKGLGAAHALSIPLDAYDLHHGTLVGMLLPAALRFARPVAADKLAPLDAIFGKPAEDGLAELNRRIGLPASLQALGVPRDALPGIAAAAAASVFNRTTIRPGQAQDYFAMLEAVF
ncbi:iron-containing alcohol dehydrogenase [Ramlibacter sp. AW1]|uniref:Iron-containing alcohol dehydrogenase n=1 Tax=Ramlibacter aurantiacus TaxID=2801330 RepID=A0A937D2C7_9BURK|nr:iron-containing alcohol dehydrogenase [Ramlibacter aurantiacus]MBL0421474.1 iron-containing alcohol dehydrogenase [Ramlibacter aurantiacus]